MQASWHDVATCTVVECLPFASKTASVPRVSDAVTT